MTDPLPLLTMFDKQIQLRVGRATVKHWVPEIMPLLTDGDPLGVEGFASHHLPLDAGPEAYKKFAVAYAGGMRCRPETQVGPAAG
jgi:threonine dehydrogenase-like Zn-dependent dehydrogenase